MGLYQHHEPPLPPPPPPPPLVGASYSPPLRRTSPKQKKKKKNCLVLYMCYKGAGLSLPARHSFPRHPHSWKSPHYFIHSYKYFFKWLSICNIVEFKCFIILYTHPTALDYCCITSEIPIDSFPWSKENQIPKVIYTDEKKHHYPF